MLVAPLHLLMLKLLGLPTGPILEKLRSAFLDQFDDTEGQGDVQIGEPTIFEQWSLRAGFSTWKLAKLSTIMAFLIATPALCWYISVPFTSMTDITAIYNSNAFWAYIFTIYLLRTETWELHKALAVILACVGVVIIAYGDSSSVQETPTGPASRLFGNLMALAGSLAFALYEVGYQKLAALPAASVEHKPVPTLPKKPARPRMDHRRSSLRRLKENGAPASYSPEEESEEEEDDVPAYPIYITPEGKLDPQVFLAHANTITVGIGAATFLILWIPVPILHYMGIEVFELPRDGMTYLAITGNVLFGVLFNAGFMMLVGLYGSVTAVSHCSWLSQKCPMTCLQSVGNLCTLVLVAILDLVLGKQGLSFSSMIGCSLIVGAFAVLLMRAWNGEKVENDEKQHRKRVSVEEP